MILKQGDPVHLVTLSPRERFAGMRRLLKWKSLRAVPDGEGGRARHVLRDGMLCEIDDGDLEEARSFCDVTIHASKPGGTP